MPLKKPRENAPPPDAGGEKRGTRDRRPNRKGRRKNSGTPLLGAAVMFFFFMMLFGAAYTLVHFDFLGARGIVIDALGVTGEMSQSKEAQLTKWETDLQHDAQNMAQEQENLKRREQELVEREAAVKQSQDDLDANTSAHAELAAQLQTNNDDITTKVIESMSADTAAAMLMAMANRDAMIRLFSQLKPATKAAILETMDAPMAASLISDH